MKEYKKPIAIMFNLSSTDIITTSPVTDDSDYEPGINLPDLEFPRD